MSTNTKFAPQHKLGMHPTVNESIYVFCLVVLQCLDKHLISILKIIISKIIQYRPSMIEAYELALKA